ncbi:hypothetical protein ACH47Z_44265 [Streptomyces sp. NPDC020192]|uniref:hypothetical protein n=1 Tax=Streptomyces sp. NPDC020192 TaxID=3365066 RepID=UPI0037AEE9CB
MGDNIRRTKSVNGGDTIDQWTAESTSTAVLEITVESLDTGNCPVLARLSLNDASGQRTVDFVTVSSTDALPSGPHRTIIAGSLGGSVNLVAQPLSDSDPGTCNVTYTFKWGS